MTYGNFGLPEDIGPYEENAGRKKFEDYDPCFDFEKKEKSEGCPSSIHTQRLSRRPR